MGALGSLPALTFFFQFFDLVFGGEEHDAGHVVIFGMGFGAGGDRGEGGEESFAVFEGGVEVGLERHGEAPLFKARDESTAPRQGGGYYFLFRCVQKTAYQ